MSNNTKPIESSAKASGKLHPAIPGIGSFLLMGVGQVINKSWIKAICFFLVPVLVCVVEFSTSNWGKYIKLQSGSMDEYISTQVVDYGEYATLEDVASASYVSTTVNNINQQIEQITAEVAKKVTSNPEVLNRVLGDGKTVGQILAEQMEAGQNNYVNPNSALYDLDVFLPLMHALIIIAAVGAFMNVIPYFWYDFNERKQKSVIRVLKVRALFEDYGNGIVDDGKLVEGIDIIRNAREMAGETAKEVSKKDYKSIKDKAERKAAKKAYKDNISLKEACIELGFLTAEKFDEVFHPEQMV